MTDSECWHLSAGVQSAANSKCNLYLFTLSFIDIAPESLRFVNAEANITLMFEMGLFLKGHWKLYIVLRSVQ